MQLIDLKNITIGSDPEFFIIDSNNNAFPSTDLFKGTKDSPEKKGDEGFAILKDNVLVEGNIPPSNTKSEFISYMKILKHMINGILNIGGLQLASYDSMVYKSRYLNHPEAREFGCSSYKNGWKDGVFRAENMNHLTNRVAGFHIHLGFKMLEESFTKERMNVYIARAFDYFVTYPSRLHHYDMFRARYYGMFGVYRDTSYGIECRALGGFFTQDKYLEWVYEQTIKSIIYCSNSDNLEKLDSISVPEMGNIDLMQSNYDRLEISLNEQLIK